MERRGGEGAAVAVRVRGDCTCPFCHADPRSRTSSFPFPVLVHHQRVAFPAWLTKRRASTTVSVRFFLPPTGSTKPLPFGSSSVAQAIQKVLGQVFTETISDEELSRYRLFARTPRGTRVEEVDSASLECSFDRDCDVSSDRMHQFAAFCKSYPIRTLPPPSSSRRSNVSSSSRPPPLPPSRSLLPPPSPPSSPMDVACSPSSRPRSDDAPSSPQPAQKKLSTPARKRAYPLSDLGGGHPETAREVAELREEWDEEIVKDLLDLGALPPLYEITGKSRIRGSAYHTVKDVQCTFVHPSGALVPDVWIDVGTLVLFDKYADVARSHKLPSPPRRSSSNVVA